MMARYQKGGVPPILTPISGNVMKRQKKNSLRFFLATTAIALLLPLTVAHAQTARDKAPGNTKAQAGQQASYTRPVPDSMVEDAILNSEGYYPDMKRATMGGQIQHAWNLSEPNDGYVEYRLDEKRIYKLRIRENMITTIEFPKDVTIATFSLGDPAIFKVEGVASNKITVSSDGIGNDTNLNLNTSNGNTYVFYIRTEGFNSDHIPDLKVQMIGEEKAKAKPTTKDLPQSLTPTTAAPTGSGKTSTNIGPAIEDLTNPKPKAGDFVKDVPFDVGKLHGWEDYKLWGDEELKPKVVYRDDIFTYIDFGEKLNSMKWPTAYVVVDGVDQLVNTRRSGNTLIVERIPKLISLKSGKKYLCLEYTGESQ